VTTIITGDAASSIPDGVTASLSLRSDGTVQVSTGCNEGGGRYVVDGTTITFSELILTDRACDAAAGAMEGAVLAVLGASAVEFQIEASSLTLHAGGSGLGLSGA
jgi:heat shock protein HslJ